MRERYYIKKGHENEIHIIINMAFSLGEAKEMQLKYLKEYEREDKTGSVCILKEIDGKYYSSLDKKIKNLKSD